MKRTSIRLIALVALTCLAAAGCTSGGNNAGGSTSNGATFTGIKGKVVALDGTALADVSVIVDGELVKTGADGTYELTYAAGSSSAAFIIDGYATTRRTFTVVDGGTAWVNATMKARGARETFDNTAGGAIAEPSGATVTFPANALVDKDGNVFNGMAVVELTYFDPNTDLLASPVPMDSAEMGGQRVILESFGMIDVELADEQGNKLEVGEGKTADIVFPVPAGLTEPPATIPLWHGITTTWRHKGDATYDADAKVYRATVDSFSSWNIDKVAQATCIRGIAKDENGDPVPGAFVFAKGLDYAGSSSTTAEADGRFCVVVRKNSKVEVTVYGYDGVGQAREVESGEKDTPIPPPCEDPEKVEDICLDVGEWTVSSVVPQDSTNGGNGNGNVAACSTLGSYDPCLDGLLAIYTCWNPTGECSIGADLQSVEWENGSRISGAGLYGPSGQLCGSLDADGMDDFAMVNPQGQKWTFKEKEANSDDATIVCPSGKEVTMTDAQGAAAQACFGTATNTSSCNDNNLGGGTCSTTSECDSGQTCCDYGDAGSYCVIAQACPQM